MKASDYWRIVVADESGFLDRILSLLAEESVQAIRESVFRKAL